MAYRFVLEVPSNLADVANVAVATAGDAQVLVNRAAHGLGFGVPYQNLTVAAHSLRVISTLYGWAGEIGATRPESRVQIGIVLHSGKRIGLHDVDAPALVAAIRRDQPWVETSAPKIGEHERDHVLAHHRDEDEQRAGDQSGRCEPQRDLAERRPLARAEVGGRVDEAPVHSLERRVERQHEQRQVVVDETDLDRRRRVEDVERRAREP